MNTFTTPRRNDNKKNGNKKSTREQFPESFQYLLNCKGEKDADSSRWIVSQMLLIKFCFINTQRFIIRYMNIKCAYCWWVRFGKYFALLATILRGRGNYKIRHDFSMFFCIWNVRTRSSVSTAHIYMHSIAMQLKWNLGFDASLLPEPINSSSCLPWVLQCISVLRIPGTFYLLQDIVFQSTYHPVFPYFFLPGLLVLAVINLKFSPYLDLLASLICC